MFVPTDASKAIGNRIKAEIARKWKAPQYYFHLRDGGHVAALSMHLKNSFFCTIDIKDFFGCISRSRVTRSLKPVIGYEYARKVAKLSTVKAPDNYPHSHYLPYGYCQSPLLSSICLLNSSFGQMLDITSNQNGFEVTVYMDDIVISSNDKIQLEHKYDELLAEAIKSKFTVNHTKSQAVAKTTHAFNIDLSHESMSIGSDRFARFQVAYNESNSLPQKRGIASYVGSVNKQQATNLDTD
ncbi:reverse transcriptase domain-containing protein [Shewanella sp. GXUN23E]|uniref:reverse transcriptase domain-containing protein n=1 Tax=Shewanella sp. GXUN23E TaxID=3422498 RepID=UPI003D7DF103